MQSSFDLGPTPGREDCEQLGPRYSLGKPWAECRIYVAQLTRMFPNKPEGCHFKVVFGVHDFGMYHEVHILFAENIKQELEYALNVKSNLPKEWDDISLAELKQIPADA